MAFGNPYGDCGSGGSDRGDLAAGSRQPAHDFTGGHSWHGHAEQISELVGAVIAKYEYLEIGVHLHSRPEQAAEKVLAAYDAGCRRFDSALGGLGGCPFAQDALVGNIATEKVVEALQRAARSCRL